jgi:hypothetical protein
MIEDGEPAIENDHCRWVRLMLDEEVYSPEEANKENIYFCSGTVTSSDKAAARPLSLLAGTVTF